MCYLMIINKIIFRKKRLIDDGKIKNNILIYFNYKAIRTTSNKTAIKNDIIRVMFYPFLKDTYLRSIKFSLFLKHRCQFYINQSDIVIR